VKIAFVHTYPIYHNLVDTQTWLQRINRERWIPALLAQMGPEVELWAADRTSDTYRSEHPDFADYPIRLFASDATYKQSKKHRSRALVEHARRYDADLHILKGVDGGVGDDLLRKYILPENKSFVFIIGGEYYSRHVPKADFVFYETEEQRRHLVEPGWRFWRSPVPDDRLLRLPKSVDTDLFRPMSDRSTEWDIVSVGRLIPRYKNYDPLCRLAEQFDVGVAGGGPAKDKLESSCPDVDWIGQVPNRELPTFLNRGSAFMHAGSNDYFPRVLAEAAACGLPLLAFSDAIAPDVLPPGCGLRLDRDSYEAEIEALLSDPELLDFMAERARTYATDSLHKSSTRGPLHEMLRRFGMDHAISVEANDTDPAE